MRFMDIDLDEFCSIIYYNPDTGDLFWRLRNPSDRCGRYFNTRFGGKKISYNNGSGYLKFRYNGRLFYAHRIAWLLHYGYNPKHQIDHIDGDRSNNRISNLRPATDGINRRNMKLRSNNTSGINGVYWHKQCNKWNARVKVNGKDLSLGLFDTLEEAAKRRKEADSEYGYHENHGRTS